MPRKKEKGIETYRQTERQTDRKRIDRESQGKSERKTDEGNMLITIPI